LAHSTVGLYDDARFSGRTIVSVRDHYDSVIDMPEAKLAAVIGEIRLVMAVTEGAVEAVRMNVAILGNRDPHVHAHVIPRFASDPEPTKTIWEDPRPWRNLTEASIEELVRKVRDGLTEMTEVNG